MIRRLHQIFLRHAEQALRLSRRGAVLDGLGSDRLRVTRLAVVGPRLLVEGRSDAPEVTLRLGQVTFRTVPQTSPGLDGRAPGFVFDVPFEAAPLSLTPAEGPETALPGFDAAEVGRARLRLWPGFLLRLLRLAPAIWRWRRHADPVAREIIKERLGLVARVAASDLVAEALEPAPLPAPPATGATLVLPVHDAFDLLADCLHRIETCSDLPWRLILVEDASTDPRVRPFLRDWVEGVSRRNRVTYLENDRNRGFIGTVNRALEAARAWPQDPVVLLNSDALVPEGWLSRLLAPLVAPDVATVTPFSNDAEIFSVPVICVRGDWAPGLADALDAAARGLGPAPRAADAPTGVGFCMALAPAFLSRLPALDPAFGRGYGEETDWCQKARALGGRHVCAPDLVVEHRGGASFGSAEKQRLIRQNATLINRRYPSYDREVQRYIDDDPLVTQRLALGLSLAGLAQEAPVPVYMAHAMGGGAEHYLEARIAEEIAEGRAAVVLRVGLARRWRIELHGAQGVTRGATDDTALMQRLIARLGRRRVIYSCAVGDPDPVTLPGVLLALAGRGEPGQGDRGQGAARQGLEVLMHDFFPISPSYTLLGRNSVYSGVPRPGVDPAEEAGHGWRGRDGRRGTLAEWQASWGALIAAADRVVVFSGSSRDILAEAYPVAADRIEVVPHRLTADVPRIAAGGGRDGIPVIGVLGNIGLQKGAGLLQDLSRTLDRNGTGRLVVLGHVDPAYPLSASAVVHGRYRHADLPGLVARYGIGAWLIPSIWPETFSFTTHEALATGMPVMAFDLGAQGEAVARAATGRVLDLDLISDMSALAETVTVTARNACRGV